MAKWFINMKKADFNGIARKYGVSRSNYFGGNTK